MRKKSRSPGIAEIAAIAASSRARRPAQRPGNWKSRRSSGSIDSAHSTKRLRGRGQPPGGPVAHGHSCHRAAGVDARRRGRRPVVDPELRPPSSAPAMEDLLDRLSRHLEEPRGAAPAALRPSRSPARACVADVVEHPSVRSCRRAPRRRARRRACGRSTASAFSTTCSWKSGFARKPRTPSWPSRNASSVDARPLIARIAGAGRWCAASSTRSIALSPSSQRSIITSSGACASSARPSATVCASQTSAPPAARDPRERAAERTVVLDDEDTLQWGKGWDSAMAYSPPGG